MAKFAQTAKKLQAAINSQPGAKISINTSQWYSKDKHRPITVYTVKESYPDDGFRKTKEIFKTYSHVQLVLFLRDYWYEMNGWEIPHDNPVWEEVKRRYGQDGVSAWDTVRETSTEHATDP